MKEKKPIRLSYCDGVELIGPYSTPVACGCCTGCRVDYLKALVKYEEEKK
jgi:hypothetical protein